MQTPYDCVLNLALPVELEEELIDLLRGQDAHVSGFSILPAEGFGAGARLVSAMEQVRGRSRRRVAQLLMRTQDVAPLVEVIRSAMPSPEMVWWTVPVTGFGRFA
jgi:hypothetical protein